MKHYLLYEFANKERTELMLRVIPPVEVGPMPAELLNESLISNPE